LADSRPANGGDVFDWLRAHWHWIAASLLVLFLWWRFSGGKQHDPNGRYVLVKDDVPCEAQREDDNGRRWCYLVLDTRSGRLEERVRKVGGQKKK
jgi:hypothetical protein